MSSSAQEEAAKVKEVFMDLPEGGDTEKKPGTGAPLVSMLMVEESLSPDVRVQTSVNSNLERVGRTLGGMAKYNNVVPALLKVALVGESETTARSTEESLTDQEA